MIDDLELSSPNDKVRLDESLDKELTKIKI
jgi:hypothetical protein